MDEMRRCPYCAEEIRAEATRCRHCRSRLATIDPERWYRDHPERKLAGVSAAVAHGMALPIGAVRLVLVILTLAFFHALGPLLYLALWLIIPFSPGGVAPLARGLEWAREIIGPIVRPPQANGRAGSASAGANGGVHPYAPPEVSGDARAW